MIRRLAAATVACAAAVAVAAPVTPAAQASAEPRNRAAVIVDTGQEVKRVCVRFDEESLSGTEILRRAGVDPVFATYGSMGEAVCSLCGVGCPGDDCFCDRSRYWAYSRAEDGRTRFTTSPVGSSSTRVGDGDVEGWRWGTGAPPPFASVEVVCGEVAASGGGGAPTPTSSSTSTPSARSPAPAAPQSPPTSAAAARPLEPAPPDAPEAMQPTIPGGVEAGAEGDPVRDAAPGRETAAPDPDGPADDEPGSSGPALLVLAAALVGLGGWWGALRRRRRT